MTLEHFSCPKLKNEAAGRWDICIHRHLEAKRNKKKSPCRKCTRPAEFVKMLVNEVL